VVNCPFQWDFFPFQLLPVKKPVVLKQFVPCNAMLMKEFYTIYFLVACISYASPQAPAMQLPKAGAPKYGVLTCYVNKPGLSVQNGLMREAPVSPVRLKLNGMAEACYFGLSRYGQRYRFV